MPTTSPLPTDDSDFRSYAVPTIRGGIRHHFRDHAWAVKVPRRMQNLQSEINAVTPELAGELHRWPTQQEVATALAVDVADVNEAEQARGCFQPASLDVPPYRDSDRQSLSEKVADPADTYELVNQVHSLLPAIDDLPDRDKLILHRRFVDHRTQTEIGVEIGVSQMQVSRLLRTILTRLQHALSV
ncbi:sigma-70 family RNA polymerase sigma factor [Kribbella amoyensis]|nr:sigma-70 family RNA polymerase sigma factor [Kribbella amoyensis]